MQDFERLGALYLGRQYDLEQAATKEDLVLYDAKDLTTHAVCIGMTGSGKTGLCLSLLEEAALDRIPALIIDPKGDLGNLLLTFPDLAPADFRPWIDEAEATRKGRTPHEHARGVAELWRRGLAEWGQDGERIAAIRLVFVDEEARGVGLGEAMRDMLMDEFRTTGHTLFDAHVLPGHRLAKNFFEAGGFSARTIVMHHDDRRER